MSQFYFLSLARLRKFVELTKDACCSAEVELGIEDGEMGKEMVLRLEENMDGAHITYTFGVEEDVFNTPDDEINVPWGDLSAPPVPSDLPEASQMFVGSGVCEAKRKCCREQA